MIWKIQDSIYSIDRGWIMGVLNVTPDSFSDGGQFLQTDRAIEQGHRMREEGAEIIDVGGESSRPGAEPVGAEEEMERVLPVIEGLRWQSDGLISIDTCKPAVARAAIRAGANIINDIRGLRDAEMLQVVAETGAGAVCMHMRGTPADMQKAPAYDDVIGEVRAFFEEQIQLCSRYGIEVERLAFDPGIGFGKTLEHNLALLRSPALLRPANRPILFGVSRKSFLGKLAGEKDTPAIRDEMTVVFTALCRRAGVEIVRVHEVAGNLRAMRMAEMLHE